MSFGLRDGFATIWPPIIVTRHMPPDADPYITVSTPLPHKTHITDELLDIAHHRPEELTGLHITPPCQHNPDVALHTIGHERGDVDCIHRTNDSHTCYYGWHLHLNARNASTTYLINRYAAANTWEATQCPN